MFGLFKRKKKEELIDKIRSTLYEELTAAGIDKKRAKKLVKKGVRITKLKKPLKIW